MVVRLGSAARMAAAGLLACATGAAAQTFEALGTRAAGMSGAHVAVADDGSAIYWNPAGLVAGGFFSLVLDRNAAEAVVEGNRGLSQSAAAIALGTPPLGLAYYRLRSTGVTPGANPEQLRVASLITHHTGATVVQSLTEKISIGATLKLVRGIAASGTLPSGDVDDLLGDAGDLIGAAHNAFDADVGIMAVHGAFRAGLTVRNLAEPDFETTGGDRLTLRRLSRAGVAYTTPGGLLVAADLDLEEVSDALGDSRTLAIGAESRVHQRAFVRSGVRFNTIGDQPGGRRPSISVGGSFAVFGSLLIDGQATVGGESASTGWGVAGRVVF